MCKFFSIVTDPENHAGKRFYFDWEYRKAHLNEETDSHSIICKHFGLDEDKCNKYEFNPLTKFFAVDQINLPVNDAAQVEEWCNALDWKKIVEPMIIKPIINPFELPVVALVLDEQVSLLKLWDSVRASVGASAWDSVRASVRASVGDSVGDSVRDSVWAYAGSLFNIWDGDYKFQPAVDLWMRGFVASFDGKTWRLHSGKSAKIVYEWTKG
jgi:hypothetical protein